MRRSVAWCAVTLLLAAASPAVSADDTCADTIVLVCAHARNDTLSTCFEQNGDRWCERSWRNATSASVTTPSVRVEAGHRHLDREQELRANPGECSSVDLNERTQGDDVRVWMTGALGVHTAGVHAEEGRGTFAYADPCGEGSGAPNVTPGTYDLWAARAGADWWLMGPFGESVLLLDVAFIQLHNTGEGQDACWLYVGVQSRTAPGTSPVTRASEATAPCVGVPRAVWP